jgi:hypothetical protein
MVEITADGIVAAGCFDAGVLHYRTHQVQDHERGHGRVQVDTDGEHPVGIKAEDSAGLAGAAAFLAGLDNEVLVQEAAGNVRDGLRREPHDLCQLHPAQPAGGPADGVKDHREVEVAHPWQVRAAPR